MRQATARLIKVWCVLIFSLEAVGGCDSADYTIVQNVESPNGKLAAITIKRRGHDSLSSDVFYIVLVDADAKLNLGREIHNDPFFVATHADHLSIEWGGAGKIAVSCPTCSLQPIDIMEKRPTSRGVSVSYSGFPNRPPN